MDISYNDVTRLHNPIIIDLRNEFLYNKGHWQGAINIPYEQLLLNYDNYLDINKTYYVYCSHGLTSKNIANILTSYGYKIYNIKEGYTMINY